ncbi:hypothetical protein BD779DRAFT_1675690 [Infundibulicybe gibba]|nr:hypothetical protein BD779DRAFT_1675690 [Infundibulicybe gibba]
MASPPAVTAVAAKPTHPLQTPHTPRPSPGGADFMHHRARHGQEYSRVESAEEDDDFQPVSSISVGGVDSPFSNDDAARPTSTPGIKNQRE